jgi:radical SAM enzyme (TIGR01210 family)
MHQILPTGRCTEGLPASPETLLNKAVLRERLKRPKVGDSLPFTVFTSGKFIQLWVNSPACKFSLSGKCTICDYWDGSASDDSVSKACIHIEDNGGYYDTLLLGTCGSCLCEEELTNENLFKILHSIAKTSIKRVILESHLVYASVEKIKTILKVLGGREVVIEYGQESTSEYVLKYCLNKPSMLNKIDIRHLQVASVRVIANVVLGAPFLTVRQRIQDAIDSIRDLLSRGVDGVVLFPVNIKPYTLIKYLFDTGYYKRVNAAEIAMALSSFTADELARIELAWFEPSRERLDAYEETGLSPQYCEKCGRVLLDHLFAYRAEISGKQRKAIVGEAVQDLCSCARSVFDCKYPTIEDAYIFLENSLTRGKT